MKWKLSISALALLIVAGAATFAFTDFWSGSRPEMDTNLGATPNEQVTMVSNETVVPDEFVAWNQFRGENGQGVSEDKAIPTEWSDSKNLQWKAKLPGPGASSPILTKSYVFVTSYSGYGDPDNRRAGSTDKLARHLTCFDRKTGKEVWSKKVANEQREDSYSGMGLPEHGYATNTPVTDGESVFVFYGKTGVIAYDLEGNEKWRTSVGTQSANRRWGSAASLILYNDLVVVNAAEEGRAIVALKKSDGEVAWKSPSNMLELCYSTPAMVKVDDKREDLVVALAGELWGINPNNGKLAWYVSTPMGGNLSPSLNIRDNQVYAFGGYRQTGSIGVKVAGKGELEASNVLWRSSNTSYVPTPVIIGKHFHWLDNKGIYYCMNVDDGKLLFKERTKVRGGGHPVYASAIAINGLAYCQTRTSGLVVIKPSESELNVVAQNEFASDKSQFNATPAVDNGQLFLRSNQYLYCVAETEE